jgi:hypothetical protein
VFKPYRIQIVQQLLDEDHRRRLDFCLQLQAFMISDDHFLEKVQFNDEVTFHVSGAANHHNVRIWGPESEASVVQQIITMSEYGDLKVKNIDTPMLTRMWQELEYRIDVCRVTCGAHIEHL